MILAHGVGTVYQLPLPLSMYLFGAAATVVASFFIRALMPSKIETRAERPVATGRGVHIPVAILRWVALVALVLALVSGALVPSGGLGLAALLFWVAWVVGTTVVCAVIADMWIEIDPWRSIERMYRVADAPVVERTPPWWLGPVLMYGLFWFELVSGSGFEPLGVVIALLAYTLYSFSFRLSFGDDWELADPFSILFGFAGRIAPWRVEKDSLYYRGLLGGVDVEHAMPKALFASLFVLLGSTTLDNVRETVGWTRVKDSLGILELDTRIVDSFALLAFAALFFLPFLLAMVVTHRSIAREDTLANVARRFGWSLIPIGVAYLLAHNAPLLMTGIPQLIRALSDPLDKGWNLLGTSGAFSTYLPSPKLVWFLEIFLIVGGHILAVVAAHRTALRIGGSHKAAVASQYAVTALMSVYTIATLWLLAQPLVA